MEENGGSYNHTNKNKASQITISTSEINKFISRYKEKLNKSIF